MAGKKLPRVYWDTNVFISLFRGCVDRTPDEARGIRHWFELADTQMAHIVTSTITYAEVLTTRLDDSQYEKFDRFMASSRVELKDATIGVMRKVRELREHDATRPRRKGQRHRLCVPDAIHLATALIYECDEFQTFDKRAKNRCTGLLSLGVLLPGSSLVICKPVAPPPAPKTPSLFDAVEGEAAEGGTPESGEPQGGEEQDAG